MEEVRIHRVVKVHQVFVMIIKIKTFDDTGHLLHTEITKRQVEEYSFPQDDINLMSA